MKVSIISNTSLAMGVVALAAYVLLQAAGSGSDPLVPAVAAFFIGCTAVLDRIGPKEAE